MRNSAFSRWLKRNPLKLMGSTSVVILILGLLIYPLKHSLGLSSYEQEAVKHISNLGNIFSNPTDILYNLTAKVLSFLFSSRTALELASVLFALATLLNVRFLIKYWYDERSANMGTLLLGTSFWFLSISKVSGASIMPAFWLSTVLGLAAWRKYTKKSKLASVLLVLSLGLSIYTPYFIWVLISLSIIAIKQNGFSQVTKKILSPYSVLALVFIAPIIYTNLNEPIIVNLLGSKGPQYNPINYLSTVIKYFTAIIVKSQLNPTFNLGRLPLLNIFETVMLAFGLVTMFKNRSTLKGLATLGIPFFTIAIISIFEYNQLKISALLPMVFVLISIGFSEFMHIWLKGFPKNPFGRSLGLLVCVIIISLSGYFNLHKYFKAWSNNPDTKAAHQLQ